MTVYYLSLLVAAFAVYRAARFVGWDKLTEKFRGRVEAWADAGFTDDMIEAAQSDEDLHGWRDYVADLVECPFCLSFWMAGIAYLVVLGSSHGPHLDGNLAVRVVYHLMVWWAIAGVVCALLRLDEPHLNVKVEEPD